MKESVLSVAESPENKVITSIASSVSFSPRTYIDMLNHNFLQELYGDDTEYAASMFSLFIGTAFPDFGQVDGLIQAERWEEVRQLLHKLKPTLAMVGLTGMEAQVATFEEWSTSADKTMMLTLAWPIFYKELNKVLPVLEAQRQQYLTNINS